MNAQQHQVILKAINNHVVLPHQEEELKRAQEKLNKVIEEKFRASQQSYIFPRSIQSSDIEAGQAQVVDLREKNPKPKLKIKIAKQPNQNRLKTEQATQHNNTRYRMKTEYNDENRNRGSSRLSRPMISKATSKSINKLPALGNSTLQLKKRTPLAEKPLANCVRTSHYKLMPPSGNSRPNHSLSSHAQDALSRSLEATKPVLK